MRREVKPLDFLQMRRLGFESLIIGLILLFLLSLSVSQGIPTVVFTIISFFGMSISVFQMARRTHGFAVVGFFLNLFIFIFSIWSMLAG